MLKYFLLLIAICIGFSNGYSQQLFPVIKGETLDGKVIETPSSIKGSYALIGFAISDKAESALMSWAQPIYDNFIAKTGMMSDMYDVKVFFVPVLTGAQLVAKDKIVRDFKSATDKELLPYVLFLDKDIDVKSQLKLDRKDVPYIFLVDPNGKIVFSESGSYSEAKLEKIEDILMEE